ncbi:MULTISPECIES: hypothetical protein [Caulobacter]|uniref:Uncharacterized protein n=1 Tax=Caulobacter rhizosphaerae TaxID=2010972 RepID=A0ABU1MY93_9CAUL|nr:MULTISPECIES: hypothetical protein [Caulobacter]MDR6531158.1 hypothetical protein [Caulobacter rhizosphaerae]
MRKPVSTFRAKLYFRPDGLGSATGGFGGRLPPTSIPPIRAKDSMAWLILDTFIGGVSRQRVETKHAPTEARRNRNSPNPDEIRTRTNPIALACKAFVRQEKSARDGVSRALSSSSVPRP